MSSAVTPLWRRAVAEAIGTGLLVTVVIGSGIAAATLSPGDTGLQLLENAFATGLGLTVLILVLGPVSGAHFNPVVSLVDWWLGRARDGDGTGLGPRDLAAYLPAQVGGAIAGAILANLMYDQPAVSWSTTDRSAGQLWLAEAVATAGLILLIFALAATGRANLAPAAVGAYIASAYWFTSSTSFANPAVTLGRAFSDTFAGIAPGSLLAFVTFQLIGGIIGAALVGLLYPHAARSADEAVAPHADTTTNNTANPSTDPDTTVTAATPVTSTGAPS